MKKAAIIIFAVFMLSGCVSTRGTTKSEVTSLNTRHFKDTTAIQKVSSGNVTEFSTLNGYRPEKYLGVNWLDSFLIGYLNHHTGERSYQVYQFISYQGPGWRFYRRVDFVTPDGKVSRPLTQLHRELLNCTSSRGCTHEEHVVFDMDERLLRKIAKRAPQTQGELNSKGKIDVFLYRLSPKKGPRITYWLLPAEVAGLLEKMDEYIGQTSIQPHDLKK